MSCWNICSCKTLRAFIFAQPTHCDRSLNVLVDWVMTEGFIQADIVLMLNLMTARWPCLSSSCINVKFYLALLQISVNRNKNMLIQQLELTRRSHYKNILVSFSFFFLFWLWLKVSLTSEEMTSILALPLWLFQMDKLFFWGKQGQEVCFCTTVVRHRVLHDQIMPAEIWAMTRFVVR